MKIKNMIFLFVVLSAIIALVGCGGGTKAAMDDSELNAKTNGGFVVETADYVYFINGVETYSTEYKTGEVVKGALMRAKKSDFKDIGTDAWSAEKSETIVSKLIVSGDYGAGFYIYGDYVYYAVPSTEKDTTGKVKSDKLNFFRTKLDGTSTSGKITSEDFGNSVKFRYAENDGKVYLAVYDTALYVYDATSGKKVYTYEDEKEPIDELVFDENGGSELYFTVKPINENLYDKESDAAKQAGYHYLYEYSLGKELTLLLKGDGKYTVKPEEDKGDEISFTGATIDLIRHGDGYLYFSYTSLDSTVGQTVYVRLKDGATEGEKNGWSKTEVLNNSDMNAADIFADGSYYYTDSDGKLLILYISSSYGLMKYDYTENPLATAGGAGVNFGVEALYYSETIITGTVLGVYGDYFYYYTTDGVFYRVNLKELLAGNEGKADETRINRVALNTSWYKPEIVTAGGKDYLIGVYSETVYGSYCYAIDVEAEKAAYEEYKTAHDEDEYYTDAITSEELKAFVETTMLGKMTDGDKTSYDEYLEDLAESESSKE